MANEAVVSFDGGKVSRLCQNCQHEDFKYKCPACGVQTCSLACTKAHRNSTGEHHSQIDVRQLGLKGTSDI